jgi:natural product biosynthesis luciferase-like monooxygenase protein
MDFGVQFFPAVGPETKSARDYWAEALKLSALADELGYSSVRTIEHYFHSYGGYSPNPLVFLAAAAMVTKRVRLITGAVLPVFNHPLKLAGEIGMVDAISNGRLEVGFARAFLPHEFARFGISLDESRARFDEGVAQVRRLLEEELVSEQGHFHSYKDVRSLPRPTQQPRPPFWVAAVTSPQSFVEAGRNGYNIMAIPMGGGQMTDLIGSYREAWRLAGHPGNGKVMLAFHMMCAPTREQAYEISRAELNKYLAAIVDSASDWIGGASSKDYAGYDKMIEAMKRETFESQVEKRAAWVGTPLEIADMIAEYDRSVGGFEEASLQVNFGNVAVGDAENSMRLFASEVMPNFIRR